MSSVSSSKYKMFCPECGQRLVLEVEDGNTTDTECPWCASLITATFLFGGSVYKIEIDGA